MEETITLGGVVCKIHDRAVRRKVWIQLDKFRKESGKTWKEIASSVGVTEVWLRRLGVSASILDGDILRRFAKKLGVELEWMLSSEEYLKE